MTHIALVVARFYEDIALELEQGAIAMLDSANATYDVIHVPGAFEVPTAVRYAMDRGGYDGFITLGCVIRGDTTHYDYVCSESARGLMQLTIDSGLPVSYGILTVENVDQAWARARQTEGNKGKEVTQVCLHMIQLRERMLKQ